MALKTLTSTSSSAPGFTVTSNGSANTYTTTAATLGTTAEQWDAIYVQIKTQSTADRNFLLQLFTNDSGSDTALGDPIPIRLQSNSKVTTFSAHVRIPSGTVIKAKCMDSSGSGVLQVALMGLASGSNVRQGPATGASCWKFVGSATTTSGAVFTSCDAGGTINTFVSTTLGTTGADANAIGFITRTALAANVDFQVRLLDDGTAVIGTTSAGTYVRGLNGDHFQLPYGPYPMDATIASGSSITAEVSCSGNTAGSREMGVVAYLQNLPALGGGSTTLIGDDMVNTETYARSAASKIVTVFIRDTSGAPKTGLAYNTASFTCYKSVGGAVPSAVTLANMTLDTYTSGGFKEIDATNMPGMYQYCPPTLSSSADYEVHTFKLSGTITQTNFVFKLTGGDPRSATVDANVTKINNTTVVGAGTSGDKWRA